MPDRASVLDVVRAHPLCAETPLPLLQQAVTPAPSVYVRSNFETPDAHADWSILVSGDVAQVTRISLDALAAMPQHEVLMTMECAGNWRLGMDPVPAGEPWQCGAVSTTRWRGVALATVLANAGPASGAVEVLARGADAGPRDDAEGIVRFERSLPFDVAMHPDTLLATHMDGEPLTPDHGAPVRLVVPNWYGMASVKWLAALDVLNAPYTGYFQVKRYVYEVDGVVQPVSRALVKSMIVSPAPQQTTASPCTVRGWAWSGTGAITHVDVAVNAQWHRATLSVPASPYAWTPFSLEVVLPEGEVTLRSRATDATGAIQPEAIVWNRLGYGNNAVRAISVLVRP
ncbi:sulfite oxidase [Gemmatimonas sp.]|uniref:sulfite oxidase n=1 Tax=Gemmatimonas sp. TaxID=1962908 RepID=UPI0037C154A8